jgi:class 3 adenylate cyclase/tetratricopeptide (TPR) repeat protein
VLFADLAGFTAYAEKRDPEEVRDVMDQLWMRLDPIITGHGGRVSGHAGDEVMGLFGAETAGENDPEHAVRAALAMQKAFAESGVPSELKMRIGIHTGQAMVGLMRTTGEFAATGDTVNIANRLEQSAPVGGILVSRDTYRHIAGRFDVHQWPELVVKGKTDPLEVYSIVRAKNRFVAFLQRGIEKVETPMIGRDSEMSQLKEALQAIGQERRMRTLTVVADAGLGKSRLLTEFQQWLEFLPESFRFYTGRATEEMAGLPFALLRDVLSQRFEIQESDSAAVAREKMERGLTEVFVAGGSSSDPVLQAHFIGHLLGLDFSSSPHLAGALSDAQQLRQRAFYYLSGFFANLSWGARLAGDSAEMRGLALVFEDLHWSDDGSLDFFEYLGETCKDAPLMILCAARPSLFERRPSWGTNLPAHRRMDLSALSSQESRTLVDRILRKTLEVPQALRELVVGGAEGNPFFIEETINMLIDERVIVTTGDLWHVQPERLAAVKIPTTLTGLLQARLDGLSDLERTVLQRAAVVGRVFWASPLEDPAGNEVVRSGSHQSAPLSPDEVGEALEGLKRKELIFGQRSSAFEGEAEYAFKHELLRKVAYESVLKKLRRPYHSQVAAWLIRRGGERVTEFAGIVASHLEQAGRASEAAEWYGRAGKQALLSYAPASAIDFFQKALALSADDSAPAADLPPKRFEWHAGLGEALGAQARFKEAAETYSALRALAEQANDLIFQARAWNGLAYMCEREGDNRSSVDSADRAEKLARQAGNSEVARHEQLRALHFKGWAFYRLGDSDSVLALGEETLRLCEELGDRLSMAISFKLYGVGHLQLGHYREAENYFEKGLALCTELGDRRNAAAMFSNLGESARLRGDYAAAVELYQKALKLAVEIGHRSSEFIYLSNLAGARLGLGQYQQAEVELRQAINLNTGRKSCSLSETYAFLADACLGQGKLLEAREAAEHAVQLGKEMEIHLDEGSAWRALGRATAALRASGDPKPADLPEPGDCFARSLAVFRTIAAEGEQARTLCAWGHYLMQQGEAEKAKELWEQSRSIFHRLGMTVETERMDSLAATG